jgi:uncharacterized protein
MAIDFRSALRYNRTTEPLNLSTAARGKTKVGERRHGVSNDFKDLFGEWRPDPEGADEEGENRPRRTLNEKEVKVVNVYEGRYETVGGGISSESTTFVLMRDNMGREFRIFVLKDVAYAIMMALENETADRPFTHDLMKNFIERLGGTVERVTIDDLWQDTFYAKVSLVRGEEVLDIDARPSDAIAIALRFRAPIYVAEDVLERAQLDS